MSPCRRNYDFTPAATTTLVGLHRAYLAGQHASSGSCSNSDDPIMDAWDRYNRRPTKEPKVHAHEMAFMDGWSNFDGDDLVVAGRYVIPIPAEKHENGERYRRHTNFAVFTLTVDLPNLTLTGAGGSEPTTAELLASDYTLIK